MRSPPYASYKPSGTQWLGELPAHWQLSRFGSHFTERREKVSDKAYPPLSVTKVGVVPQVDGVAKTDDNENRKLVLIGDFVINGRSDRRGSSGLSRYNGSVSLINLVLQPRGIERPYVHHLLRSYSFQEEFYRFGKGIVADLWSTGYAEMKGITLPLPPSGEQTAIAFFLDRETARIDSLIAKKERLLGLLEEKRIALISQAVTKGLDQTAPMKGSGGEWIGVVPRHWRVGSLRWFWTVLDCKHLTVSFVDDGIPLASIREVGGIDVDLSAAKQTTTEEYEYLIEGGRRPGIGDIIYSRNASVGEASIVATSEPFAMGQDVCLMRSSEQNSRYLMYLLKSQMMQAQVESLMIGSTFRRINFDQIKSLQVCLPPTSEQDAIAVHCDAIQVTTVRMAGVVQTAITLLREYRTALITAAVTGQIDVRGEVGAERGW